MRVLCLANDLSEGVADLLGESGEDQALAEPVGQGSEQR